MVETSRPIADEESGSEPTLRGLLDPLILSGGSVSYKINSTGKQSRFFSEDERESTDHITLVVQDLVSRQGPDDLRVLAGISPEIAKAGPNETDLRSILADALKHELIGLTMGPKDLSLRHAIQARYFGKSVRTPAHICGEGVPRNFAEMIEVRLQGDEEKNEFVDVSKEANHDLLGKVLFGRNRNLTPVKGSRRIDWREGFVRQLPGEEKFEEQAGRPVPVHFVGCKIPSSRKVSLTGIVTEDAKKGLTMLVYKVTPLQVGFEGYNPSLEDLENFTKYFQGNQNIESDIDETIAPAIVGRSTAKLAVALNCHSPLELSFEGRRIRGRLLTGLFGDSTTGKSQILRSVYDLGLSEKAIAETSSRAGLLYTVDTDANAIIWGVIPMADLGQVLIDGFQGLAEDQIPQFREALREGSVKVDKRVRGEQPARARIIAAGNPRRPMQEYADRAEALLDIASIAEPSVDLTRWDDVIPFGREDVGKDLIANAGKREPRIPQLIFVRSMLWAWGLKAQDIVFEPASVERIRAAFQEFVEISTPRLPLVHFGFKEVLARRAASFAILLHSTSNHRTVQVTAAHVDQAIAYSRELLQMWEYEQYTRRVESISELSNDELGQIQVEFADNHALRRTFESIAERPGIESAVIAEKIGQTKRHVIDHTNKLKALGLIESQARSHGYRLSRKGVTYYRKTRADGSAGEASDPAGQRQLEPAKVQKSSPRDVVTRDLMPILQAKYNEVADEIVILACEEKGYRRADVEKLIQRLVENGELYRPQFGTLRLPREGPVPPRTGINEEHWPVSLGNTSRTVGDAPISSGNPTTNIQSTNEDLADGETGQCSVCGKKGPLKPGRDGFLRCTTCIEQQPMGWQ